MRDDQPVPPPFPETGELFEGRPVVDGITLAERISGDTGVGHAVAYAAAVEEALGIEVDEQAARDLGVLGYVARACGLDDDARSDHPFVDLAGELRPVRHSGGDVLARFNVRVDEGAASIDLVTALLPRVEAVGVAGKSSMARISAPGRPAHGLGWSRAGAARSCTGSRSPRMRR
jgi:Ni,Fe-hydrogenase III large subunit